MTIITVTAQHTDAHGHRAATGHDQDGNFVADLDDQVRIIQSGRTGFRSFDVLTLPGEQIVDCIGSLTGAFSIAIDPPMSYNGDYRGIPVTRELADKVRAAFRATGGKSWES